MSLRTSKPRLGGGLVIKLSRLPGAREARWMHLLSGVPEDIAGDSDHISVSSTTTAMVSVTEIAALKAQIARLDQECAALRTLVEKLYLELGVSR